MSLISNIKSKPDQLVQDIKSDKFGKILLKDLIISSLYYKESLPSGEYYGTSYHDVYEKSFYIENGSTLVISRDTGLPIPMYYELDILDTKKLTKKCNINKIHFKNYFNFKVTFEKLIGNFENNFELALLDSNGESSIWIDLDKLNPLPKFGSNVKLYDTVFMFKYNLKCDKITEDNLATLKGILEHFDSYINGSKKTFIEKGIYLHPGNLNKYNFPDLEVPNTVRLVEHMINFLYYRVCYYDAEDKDSLLKKFFLDILPVGVPIYFKGDYKRGITVIKSTGEKENFEYLVERYTKTSVKGSRKDYNFTRNKKFIVVY